MQTRLVALIVESAQSGKSVDVLATTEKLRPREREDAVEAGIEHIGSHLTDECRHIMGHIESVLPGVTLLKTAPHLHGVEMRDELAVSQPRTHEVC